MISSYLIDIIILLLAAVVAVPLFQAARLGAVPGFVIAGVIVGPAGLGLISNVSEISHLSEIGVVLLLFVIGIELKPSRLWQMRVQVFGLGTLQVVLTGILLGGISHLIFDVPLRVAILVGPALALSSTAFVLQILNERKLLSSRYGRTSLAILLMQDLAVVPLLALIPLLTAADLSIGEDIGLALAESLFILLLLVLIARHLLHPVLYRVVLSGNPEVFTASAVLIVLGTALATEHAGLSMAMGAFLAGLLISDSFYRHQVLAEIQPFRGLLLGLFFMSMGMSVNLNLLIESPVFTLALVALLITLKIAVLFPIAYLFRLNFKISLAVALILAQSGEFALVLFSLAHQATLLADEFFQLILLVVLLSMIATPVLAHFAHRLLSKQDETTEAGELELVEAPIILAGFGRVGHRIGEILTLANKPFVALDLDAEIVQRERARGHPVFYGDVRKPDILKAVGSDHAQAIIVTLNDPAATNDVVASLRNIHPEIRIFARGQNLEQCRNLHRLGTYGLVSENFEASMELARQVMTSIGFNEQKKEEILDNFRQSYYARISETSSDKQ